MWLLRQVGRHGSAQPARAFLLSLSFSLCLSAMAAELPTLEEAQKTFLAGQYAAVIESAEQALRQELPLSEWSLLLARSFLATGRYPDALAVITNALAKYTSHLRLRLLARDVFLSNGQTNHAREALRSAVELIQSRPWAYREAPDLVAAGQVALWVGNDPRQVLEHIFDVAKKADPSCRDVYLASGQLALDKHDFDLAAKTFREGLKQHPSDPDLHYGLAKAHESGRRGASVSALASALAVNSNHVPSLLLRVDHLIDAEEYAAAEKRLDHVRAVNPWHPEAWAYRAVLAHLRGDRRQEDAARQAALKHWAGNPRVDHLIGLKLSQKYRFAEGAAHQRQALSGDAHYLPAKAQLAQDLLRLGQEAEGWRLAQEVHDQDGYDVAAYNLVTLHGTMGKYATLTNADFVVRMSAHEADVYGPRVLGLLGRAKQQLCAKYDLKLTQPIVVEIFPDPRDFGVRTFGLPDNPGFLGVCFGRVITANSPAQHTSHPVNWEAVLWHEFAHVVTLHLTRNRMPRWLSEGISVYEERQAHRGWGQDLTPRYRQKILDGELTPIAQLSGAFLSPKSAADLDFAYFQSSLVVEFLVTRFGLDRLKSVLADLGEGREINRALEKHAAPLATLEPEFEAFARRHAEALAPRLDWEEPGLELLRDADGEALAAWLKARPTNFWALMREGQRFLDASQWREAQAPLRQVIERFPAFTGPDNAYALLARSYRALHETNAELDVLSRLAAEDAAAPEAYQRLMELCAARQDWTNVIANARRYLAVNPLVSLPYRHLAEAAEALDCTGTAIEAYRALLKLNPSNPAEVHFRLARRLHARGDAEARQHLLEALEEAPRFREALQLLLEAHRTGSTQENARRTALPSEVSP